MSHDALIALIALAWGFCAGCSAWAVYGIIGVEKDPAKALPRIAYVVVTLILLVVWFILPVLWLFDPPGEKVSK